MAVITRLLAGLHEHMRPSGEDIPDGPVTLEVVIDVSPPRFTLTAPAFGVLHGLATSDLKAPLSRTESVTAISYASCLEPHLDPCRPPDQIGQ